MIPEEVAIIAKTLIEEDLELTYDEAIEIAYKIYRSLKFCQCD